MYAYMRGEVVEINLDYIVLDVNGIGYMIYVPSRCYEELSTGETIKVHTYLSIREDAHVLFGFLEKDDLEMFKKLIGVSGIGPKGGISILSTMTSDDVRFAIASGDSKAIAKAPGIGAKTAQRVIIDLKDKVSFEEALEGKLDSGVKAEAGKTNSARNDAIMALCALGYSQSESLRAVSGLEIAPDMDVEDILRQALKLL